MKDKILVIDDEQKIRMILKRMLESNGFIVKSAGDGREGLAIIESFDPVLVLLDLKMPKRDGREVVEQLKSDPQLRRIPIVALTTSTAADDVAFLYDMGVNSYVTKPVTFRDLVDMMRTLSNYWFELVELPPVE